MAFGAAHVDAGAGNADGAQNPITSGKSTGMGPSPWFKAVWPWLVLLLIPQLLFVRALGYDLLYLDDDTYYANPALHAGAWPGPIDLWRGFWFCDYAPISQLTQWLDLALGGNHQDWMAARIQSALWLGIGAAGVFAVLRRMVTPWTAWIIAFLYVVHPLCVDATLWLGERKNLVAIACLWWSLDRYIAWRENTGKTRAGWGFWAGAMALGMAAMLAKPHAVALPVVMAGWEMCCGPGKIRTRLLAVVPMGVMTAAFVAMEMTMRRDLDAARFGGSLPGALWCDGDILARYLLMVVRPLGLTLYFATDDDPAHVGLHLACWAAVFAVVGLSLGVAKRRRLVLCAWLMGFGVLIPVLNIVRQPVPMAGYYVQWALPFFLLAVGISVADALAPLATRLRAQGARLTAPAGMLAGALAALFIGLTWSRVPEYTSRITMFLHAAQVQPDCAVNLAAVVSDDVLLHGRYRVETGQMALRAVKLPSAKWILSFALNNCAVEAAVEAWREHGRAAAAAALDPFPAGVHSVTQEYWIQAMVLIGGSILVHDQGGGPICLQEADGQLSAHFGPDLLAAAETFGARCRDGSVLPDDLPPFPVAVPTATGDPYWVGSERRDQLRLGLALAEVRKRAGNGESAFNLAALCLNLEPQDPEARLTMAWIYDSVLQRRDLAQRTLARQGAAH